MSDEPGARDDRGDREDRNEPLGDVAEKVRERAGDRREPSDHPDREGPLADVATKVDERRRGDREGADAFESIEVGELDGEKLWERLADDGDGPGVTVPPGESVAVEDEAWEGRDVRTIPKETCHGCPHFADPPELACTHEDTAILAMPDAEHFRVVDCPMVVEEEEEIGSIAVGENAGSATGDDGVGADADDAAADAE